MQAHLCIRVLARHARSGAALRHLSCAAPTFPSPPADLPLSASAPDARSQQAEALVSCPSPSAEAAATAYTLASAAAAAGCARGQVLQGGLLSRGAGVAADAERAHELFESSALAGDAWGMVALAQSLLEEPEEHALQSARVNVDDDGRAKFEADDAAAQTPAQVVRASRKARRAAGFADAEGAAFEAYRAAERERTRATRRAVAKQWLQASAARGLDAAMMLLGNCAVHDGEFAQAVRHYEDAIAKARNTDAYYNLGVLLAEGAEGVEKDEKRAYKCLAMAAQLGDATAQCHLGKMLNEGTQDREPDPAAARTYFELAAAQMHAEALYCLAGMHRAGEAGLERCEKTYLRFLRMAAEGGFPDAEAELGDLYYKGEAGVTRDYKQALGWFERAGGDGHADAMCSAAAMYYHGRGTEVDKHQAFLRYQDAVALESLAGMRNLGAMYFHGDGVPRNHTLAEQFFKLADEREKQEMEEAKEFEKMPIRTESAPPHPMSEIPRDTTEQAK